MWKELIKTWKSDNLLNQAWDQSYEMLDISQEMFFEAVRILRESDDTVVSMEIRKKDKLINKYEREVRRKVMTHCMLQGPLDLPGGMVLVSIVIDIERIGDYTKNILELAENHPQQLSVSPYENTLQEMEKEIKGQFSEIIDVLKESDADKARELMDTFKAEISKNSDQIVDNLVRGKIKDISPNDSTALALYARYLKRISSHLNNIVTSVVNPFDRIGFKEKKTQ